MSNFELSGNSDALATAICAERLMDPLSNEGKLEFAETLRKHGWGAVTLSPAQFVKVAQWEETFSSVFSLPMELLERAGLYRGVQGVSVGYRHDPERKFIECRMTRSGVPCPRYATVADFDPCVAALYEVLCEVCEEVLKGVAQSLSLDERVFVDLTDVRERGRLSLSRSSSSPAHKPPSETDNCDSEEKEHENEQEAEKKVPLLLSSSLLRICKYHAEPAHSEGEPQTAREKEKETNTQTSTEALPGRERERPPRVSFGAHTDTSFVTLGLVSSSPGLELVDLSARQWVSPEAALPRHCVLVFVGEFLQVLTKNRFTASVHRVRENARSHTHTASIARVSCPLLVREHPDRVISFHSERYSHPGGESALADDLVPQFDGMRMKMIHKLLEMKRKKCFERHGSAEGDWVLSSFPIDGMPDDTNAWRVGV